MGNNSKKQDQFGKKFRNFPKSVICYGLPTYEVDSFDNMDTFGQRLEWARDKSNLSAEKLGKAVGRNSSTIYHWEKGKSFPRLEDLLTLVKTLDVDANWLLFGEESWENLTRDEQNLLKLARNIGLTQSTLRLIAPAGKPDPRLTKLVELIEQKAEPKVIPEPKVIQDRTDGNTPKH